MNIQRLPLNPCGGGGCKKPNYGTQCWEMKSYLPIEIIEQIILVLPAKSIGRCRCVSKQWRALLSSLQFIKAHTNIVRSRSPHSQSVSILSDRSSKCFTSTYNNQVTASGAPHNLFRLPSSTCLKGSCDGLVLVVENGSQFFLINPTTRHTREIPTIITRRAVGRIKTTVTLDGIGFDPITNDYKVVSVSQIYNDSSNGVLVHIYSVNDGIWKTCFSLPNFFGCRLCPHNLSRVFLGRCIHWLIQRATDHVPAILSFDVVEERFSLMPNPTHHSFQYRAQIYDYYLHVFAGRLCIRTMSGGYLNVWVMNKYGIQESWTRIARIGGVKSNCFMPLCLVVQENLVLLYSKNYILEKLVTYNMAEKTFKDVDLPHAIKDLDYHTITFAETMVSPYGMRGES